MGDHGKLTADRATPSPPPRTFYKSTTSPLQFARPFVKLSHPLNEKKKKRRPEVEILFCSNRQENVLLKS